MHPRGDGITMCQAVSALADAEHGDAVIVTDVGQNQMFGARYSRFNSTRSFITSGGLGTMGFGLPAAIGAKLGMPGREVVAILGDGGFQMTIQELGTIKQEQLGLKIVVLNNSYLGMVRQWQQLFHDRRYSFTPMDNPDFTMIASAYGIPADRVSDPAELPGAMRKLALFPRSGRPPRRERIPDGTRRRIAVKRHVQRVKLWNRNISSSLSRRIKSVY